MPYRISKTSLTSRLLKPAAQQASSLLRCIIIQPVNCKDRFSAQAIDRRKDWHHFETGYFVGCAHAIHRDIFEKTGYYPTNFFYGMEEYDLSYRAIDAGFDIVYDDRVIILHKESPLGRQTKKEKTAGHVGE